MTIRRRYPRTQPPAGSVLNMVAEGTYVSPDSILNGMADGVYVTDVDRRILYWSKSAERITGWASDQVVGKSCMDNILCHIDKNNRVLCGKETCPLHRAIVTGKSDGDPLLVYAKTKDHRRVAVQVRVAPIANDEGEIIGGVEVFRNFTGQIADLERARRIQQQALVLNIHPDDPHVSLRHHYRPADIVGGNYLAADRIGERQFALMQADVVGRGLAAALQTMYLRVLWEGCRGLQDHPGEFLTNFSRQLRSLFGDDSAFATAFHAYIDLDAGEMVYSTAGHPAPSLLRSDGRFHTLASSDQPLGIGFTRNCMEHRIALRAGDRLFVYTHGILDILNRNHEPLGIEGLRRLLLSCRDSKGNTDYDDLDEALLRFSDTVSLPHDISIAELNIHSRD